MTHFPHPPCPSLTPAQRLAKWDVVAGLHVQALLVDLDDGYAQRFQEALP